MRAGQWPAADPASGSLWGDAGTQHGLARVRAASGRNGDYAIAAIVFLASIFIPLLKLLGLFFLVATTRLRWAGGKMLRTRIYRVIESIGRWAMLDVFVLAILVSLVKLRSLATIIPGKGALAFAMVVVCTLLASASFDSQLNLAGATIQERSRRTMSIENRGKNRQGASGKFRDR